MSGPDGCVKETQCYPRSLAVLSNEMRSFDLYIYYCLHLYFQYECFAYPFVCAPCVCWVPTQFSRVHRILWTEVGDDCELLYECWQPDADCLEEP